MKRRLSLLLLALVMIVSTGWAQSSQQRVIKLPEKMAKVIKSDKKMSKSMLQRQVKKSETQQFARRLFAYGKTQSTKAAAKKATRRAYDGALVTDQPEGESVLYTRDGLSYVNTMFGIYEQEVLCGAVTAVFADNNVVWLNNLITGFNCPGWVKGTVDGSTIVIQLPQPVLESGGELFYADLLTYDEEQQFYFPKSDKLVVLNYDATTGAISASGDLMSGNDIIGLTDASGEWYGYGDWSFTMNKFDAAPTVAPADLEVQQYFISADGYAGHLVQVGFQGDDVYVQGIYSELPQAWVKGTISDGKVTFKNATYIGATTYHQYLVSATEEVIEDPWGSYSEYSLSDADITFDYDAATKTLTNGSLCMVNAGIEDVNYAIVYKNGKIAPFVETAATPAAASELSYEHLGYEYYAVYGYGWGNLTFNLDPVDADGNFILKDKLSYAIYTRVNGEEKVLEFSPDDYLYLDESMTEIPFGFSDGWDISNGSIYLYINGVDAYGIQTIYRGAGEERRSAITWVETGLEPQPEKVTPEYPALDPDNVGGSIVYSYYTGKESTPFIGDKKAQTYDVAMKLQDRTLVGTHIDKITFPLLSTENISNLKVWLSTNLRVENGVNVPNLVEIPVDATESGYIEVALPTPYTISEEGVYVGYSMTVTELDDNNALPIAVVQGANDGGLYIHTSDVYLKWMDMSAEIGASAYIGVQVSGKSVMDNAVVPQANETAYVKVGDAFEVSTTVANYGAKGISSLDIDYTLNGKTESRHFDLEKAVQPILGLTTTVTAQIPAIAERGSYTMDMKVTKVNGVANEAAQSQAVTPVIALNNVPKKRALLEEYTGTWCGWCPRGLVALEMLAQLYPDDYVLVSYHNGDPMEILTSDEYVNEFPSPVSGFPDAFVDRVIEADPYYGYGADYGVTSLGITKPLSERNAMFGHADIQVKAELSDDQNKVNIATTVAFPYDAENANYGLEYVLVADGLTGTGSEWAQANYYSGDETETDPYLSLLAKEADYIEGISFNDVAVKVSNTNGIAIEGSIPATIVADQPIENTYSFSLDEVYNTSFEAIPFNVNKLKVVAILVNNTTGEVLNANGVKVDLATGIKTVKGEKAHAGNIYNLNGQRVQRPAKGLYIVNGKKIIVK